MLRALSRLLGRRNPQQLELTFDGLPASGPELLVRLRLLGMGSTIQKVRLTRNRMVMVSFSGHELRIHEGYLHAPEPVLRAVVAFVRARSRADRARARADILGFPVSRPLSAHRRTPRTAAADEMLARELYDWYERYNARHFGGALSPVAIRVSRRMKTRLGHYTARSSPGEPAEIAISRSHVQRHGWEEARHTLLHEMVHQWQDECGHPIDHGATFRAKAREVGITPFARRTVVPQGQRGAAPRKPAPFTVGLRAAREE
ncbi:MAG: SprT-like domain-containing protein [Gemmatimonadaceae bacterium]